MVYFRKRLSPEILGQINELIIQKALEEEVDERDEYDSDENDNSGDDDGNEGTLIVDAICTPSDIQYPTDTSLLNEARWNSEKLIDMLHISGSGEKPRTYRRRAHKEYNQFVRARKPGRKKIHNCIRKQLGYLGRNLDTIEKMLETGGELPARWQERLETLQAVFCQQQKMYQSKTHTVERRIVSISRPYLRPIVRGKAKSPVEFGAKLDISVVDGYTRLETYSFEAYNEACFLKTVIERYRQRTGHYPREFWQTKFTETARTCGSARSRVFGFPGQHLAGRKRMHRWTKGKIMPTFVNAWRWSEKLV